MSLRCDALIVGGGPAGLAAAIALRRKGLDVLVADALHPPIDKACGEGLMPDARRDLAALGVPAHEGVPFDGIAFFSGSRQVAARFEGGSGIGIRRLRLHSLLEQRCRELGVRLSWGSHVRLAQDQPPRLNGEMCICRYAIGADGQSSRMRSAIGLGQGRILTRRYGARSHFRVRPWSQMVEVHWGDRGQAYITPVGEEEVCVATVSRVPESRIDEVLQSLPRLKARLAGAAGLSARKGALTTNRILRRVTDKNVALIGDASGSVDAVTGEGLGLSFRQALLLADAIAAGDLEIYEAGHALMGRIPHLMSNVMLRMDAWPWLRERTMRVLSAEPGLFARLLALHIGQRSLGNFLLRDAPRLSLGLLT
ncbi:MAG: FAD-dependent monooxygenase [Acidobacteriaceae bacterium]